VTVSTPCYCTREDVKRALDIPLTGRNSGQVDRAIQAAARDIEGRLQRKFYPNDTTRYFDWPNFQSAYPWRIWFNQNELAAPATQVTTGGTVIDLADIFFEPVNSAPPYTYMELNRSTSAAFGLGPTPQRDVAVTGTFGYDTAMDAVAALTAAVSSTTAATVSVSDSSQLSAGAILIIDSERLLVQDSAFADTGVAFAGLTTASAADNELDVPDPTVFTVGEVICLDSERCLILDTTPTALILKRAWDGSILASHSSGEIYAPRLLTVSRGALGTAAATHSDAATVNKHHVPSLVRELAVAVSVNGVLQETSGYSRMVGEGDSMRPAAGSAIAAIWDEAITRYGRKSRQRVI
jgi:hypothetical protein